MTRDEMIDVIRETVIGYHLDPRAVLDPLLDFVAARGGVLIVTDETCERCREHKLHLTDGRWHDDCWLCGQRRRTGGDGTSACCGCKGSGRVRRVETGRLEWSGTHMGANGELAECGSLTVLDIHSGRTANPHWSPLYHFVPSEEETT